MNIIIKTDHVPPRPKEALEPHRIGNVGPRPEFHVCCGEVKVCVSTGCQIKAIHETSNMQNDSFIHFLQPRP